MVEQTKKKNLDAFLRVMFCFGEIDEGDDEIHYSVFLDNRKNKNIHQWVKKAFLLVCPKIRFGSEEKQDDYYPFDWKVTWDHGEMDEKSSLINIFFHFVHQSKLNHLIFNLDHLF